MTNAPPDGAPEIPVSVPPAPPPPAVQTPPHPRDVACDNAGRELVMWINDWRNRHALTTPEFLWLMLQPVGLYVRQIGQVEREAILRGVQPSI